MYRLATCAVLVSSVLYRTIAFVFGSGAAAIQAQPSRMNSSSSPTHPLPGRSEQPPAIRLGKARAGATGMLHTPQSSDPITNSDGSSLGRTTRATGSRSFVFNTRVNFSLR
jgi:hypothetical protein